MNISHATAAEYRIAALALVYHATSTGAQDSLKELMARIESSTPSWSPDAAWKPPPEWKTTQQDIIDLTRDWLEQATPNDTLGTISPVIYVAENTYHIFTTTNTVYNWRRRLCARLKSTSPLPLLAPSWDSKTKKTRLVFMFPQLARMVQAEFKDMDRLLQAAVNVMSMEAVTSSSPSKADVKRQKAAVTAVLAETQAELAETRRSLAAEVGF